MVALGLPGTPLGDLWRRADRLREYRGDSHTAAWAAAGFDAAEIGLVTERWWGLPARSYVRTRGWSDADLDAAERRLEARGVWRDGDLTGVERAAREDVERATDRQCRPVVAALGDDLEDVVAVLGPWGARLRAARAYLPSGPHDLAAAASS